MRYNNNIVFFFFCLCGGKTPQYNLPLNLDGSEKTGWMWSSWSRQGGSDHRAEYVRAVKVLKLSRPSSHHFSSPLAPISPSMRGTVAQSCCGYGHSRTQAETEKAYLISYSLFLHPTQCLCSHQITTTDTPSLSGRAYRFYFHAVIHVCWKARQTSIKFTELWRDLCLPVVVPTNRVKPQLTEEVTCLRSLCSVLHGTGTTGDNS